jgi:hypothetical protein
MPIRQATKVKSAVSRVSTQDTIQNRPLLAAGALHFALGNRPLRYTFGSERTRP